MQVSVCTLYTLQTYCMVGCQFRSAMLTYWTLHRIYALLTGQMDYESCSALTITSVFSYNGECILL